MIDGAALPVLDADIVSDDDDLWDAIQGVLAADASASRRRADVDDWLAMLAACIDDDGVLHLADEVRVRVVAEAEDLALAIARWAFAEGRRSVLPRPEGSS